MQRSHAMQNADLTARNEALAQDQASLLAEVQRLRNFVASKQPSLEPLLHHIAGHDQGPFKPEDVNEAVNTHNLQLQDGLESFGHWTSGLTNQAETDAFLAQRPAVARRLFDSPSEMARPIRPSTIEESVQVANAGGHGRRKSSRGNVATNSGASAINAAGGTTAGDGRSDQLNVPRRDISHQRDQA